MAADRATIINAVTALARLLDAAEILKVDCEDEVLQEIGREIERIASNQLRTRIYTLDTREKEINNG